MRPYRLKASRLLLRNLKDVSWIMTMFRQHVLLAFQMIIVRWWFIKPLLLIFTFCRWRITSRICGPHCRSCSAGERGSHCSWKDQSFYNKGQLRSCQVILLCLKIPSMLREIRLATSIWLGASNLSLRFLFLRAGNCCGECYGKKQRQRRQSEPGYSSYVG